MGGLVTVIKKVVLCGPDGPTGAGSLVSGSYRGLRAAFQGDAVGAARGAAGIWGGASGSVGGFLAGGPPGALVGGVAGSYLAGKAAGSLVKLGNK